MALLPAIRSNARILSSHDAMHGGFSETELSGNDAYAVTLRTQLSNLLAIDPKSVDLRPS